MKIEGLSDILDWMKTTDLVEISFKKGSEGFALRAENAPQVHAPFPTSTLVAVASPGVGIFRWGRPGTPRQAEEGKPVVAGSALGVIELGSRTLPVSAQAGGRLLKVLVQDGAPVEYG